MKRQSVVVDIERRFLRLCYTSRAYVSIYFFARVLPRCVTTSRARSEERGVLHRLEAEEARHANHRGAAVEQLLLLGEGADGVGHGVGGEHLEGGGDEERDGHEHGGGRIGELLRDGLAGGDLGAGGGDEAEHGEAAVHELGAGGDEVGALGAGEGERLLQGEGLGRGRQRGLHHIRSDPQHLPRCSSAMFREQLNRLGQKHLNAKVLQDI